MSMVGNQTQTITCFEGTHPLEYKKIIRNSKK